MTNHRRNYRAAKEAIKYFLEQQREILKMRESERRHMLKNQTKETL